MDIKKYWNKLDWSCSTHCKAISPLCSTLRIWFSTFHNSTYYYTMSLYFNLKSLIFLTLKYSTFIFPQCTSVHNVDSSQSIMKLHLTVFWFCNCIVFCCFAAINKNTVCKSHQQSDPAIYSDTYLLPCTTISTINQLICIFQHPTHSCF